ncbi:MAG TPA: alpha/beta hydrolase, partial [Candidatus Hydrogenedentes bacterium]|nr:alpha/beta hydrolase [Candidatus Hydrogenedentota bacterium]
SEQRCYEDIRAAWRHLTEERGIPSHEIVLFGRSLGGGATAQLAAEVTPACIILESTFTSVVALSKEMLPWLPMGRLIRHRFDNLSKVGRFTSPLLVVHSRDDRLIPYRHGRELFERAPEPKRLVEIRGDHSEGFVESLDIWLKGLDGFLGDVLTSSRSS